jgi:hypothetical protein
VQVPPLQPPLQGTAVLPQVSTTLNSTLTYQITGGIVTDPNSNNFGGWILPNMGWQKPHLLPTVKGSVDGVAHRQCIASGYGWRREQLPDGSWRMIGVHPQLRTNDAIIRDIPANHYNQSSCMVEVIRRRPVGQ